MVSLIALRDQLDADIPIDYAHRRALDYSDLLPPESWRDICVDLAIPVGRSTRARLHRYWLYERLTGSPAVALAPGRGDPAFRALLADLPRTLSPDLIAVLDDVGREFLGRHDVRNDPVTWGPDLLEAGIESAEYRRTENRADAIHRLVAEELSLGHIARRLDTTINVIREVLTEHPTP
jgi:hypothetical protein